MIRLHIVAEGQTEEEFVNSLLATHLGNFNISTDVRCVETSRRRAKIYRGGVIDYGRLKKDLTLWMKEDQNSDAHFTTMLDLYRLPKDFPGCEDAKKLADATERVAHLEECLAGELKHPRFTAYFQLHEFEALLLSDPSKFESRFLEHSKQIQNLIALCSSFSSPELIDDGPETSPSKRIIKEIPEYEGTKASAGPLIAGKIGLAMLRAKCPHFNAWLAKLEQLSSQS